jgi:hypothetical protein
VTSRPDLEAQLAGLDTSSRRHDRNGWLLFGVRMALFLVWCIKTLQVIKVGITASGMIWIALIIGLCASLIGDTATIRGWRLEAFRQARQLANARAETELAWSYAGQPRSLEPDSPGP